MNLIYSAIFGNYDSLQPITPPAGWRAIVFSDTEQTAKGWEVIRMDGYPKAYRHIKTCPHLFLPGSTEMSVWVDGNIIPSTSRIRAVHGDYTLMAHPHRSSVWAEAKRCIELNKDSAQTINAQMDRYRAENYPDVGMVATGVIIRKAGNEAFAEDWWKEIKNGSVRDQLSFNYVAHKHGLKYDTFPFLEGFKKRLHAK